MKRNYNDWIQAYLEFTEATEAPKKLHFWTAVSTIAGALRRKVWIDMGHFYISPNFYIVFVAPPGVATKSTTANIGMSLLKEIPGINFGPDSGTWQGLVYKMLDLQEMFEAPDGNYYPMTAVNCFGSELGTFLNPRDDGQMSTLIDLWDNKRSFDKLTKWDGSQEVIAPWINFLGATTPSWIAENVSDQFHRGGLASRMIFVYCETKRKLIAFPFQHLARDIKTQKGQLVEDLEQMASLAGPYQLSNDAIEWGEDWYKRLHVEENPYLKGDKFQGYLSRKQTHLLKLGMVLAAAKRNERVITDDDLKQADKELTNIEAEMPQVFGHMNQEKEMYIAADVWDYLLKHGKMRQQDLYYQFLNAISFQTFQRIIQSLQQSGVIQMVNKNNEMWIEPTRQPKR